MGLATSLMIKWPVRWDWPLPIASGFSLSRDPLKVASPMGLATPHSFRFQPVSRPFESGQSHGTGHFIDDQVASPMGLATPHSFRFQPVSRPFESGQSHGTGHFIDDQVA